MGKNIIVSLLIVVFCSYYIPALPEEDIETGNKKLILWHRPIPTSEESVIRNRYRHYKNFLDGLIYTTGINWKTPPGNFDRLIENNYRGLSLRRRVEIAREEGLKENFIDILLFARQELQWMDEEKWASAITLLSRVASRAKDIGCVGISLDVEPYGVQDGKGRIFSRGPNDLALKRGKEVGEAIFKEFSRAKLMLIFPASFMTRKNFLYFVRGLAESPLKEIHMGWEEFYYSTKPEEIKAQDVIYNLLMILVMNNDQNLLSKCGIAPGIWPGIHENRTRLTPEEVQIDKRAVFKIAREYVWLFPPGVNWLEETEYIKAIKPTREERNFPYAPKFIFRIEFIQQDNTGKILNRMEFTENALKNLLQLILQDITTFMFQGGRQKIPSRISGEKIPVEKTILPENSYILITLSDATLVPLVYRGDYVFRLYPHGISRGKISLPSTRNKYFIDLELRRSSRYIASLVLR